MFTTNSMISILKQISGKTTSGLASSAYLALSQTAPNVEGGGVTEPVGGGYQRAKIGTYQGGSKMGNPTYDSSTGKVTITNVEEIHFNEATSGWGTITHFAIYSSQTGGEPLYIGQLNLAISPTTGNVVIIKVGDIKISIE